MMHRTTLVIMINVAPNIRNTIVEILCFKHKEIKEITQHGIRECGDLRRYRLSLFTAIKDPCASSFSVNPFLFHVWIPFNGRCDTAAISHIWMEGGKAEVGPFDRRLFESRLYVDDWERGTRDRRRNNDSVTGSPHSERNGWVRFHARGAKHDTVFQTWQFCLTQLDFYFHLGSCSLQTVPPTPVSSAKSSKSNWTGIKRPGGKTETWTIRPGSWAIQLTFWPSWETGWAKCW